MDTAALLLRLVVALASVCGLVWLFSRGMTRGRGRRLVPGMTEVVSRQVLSRAASVVVVRVGDRALVLGVTEQQVSLLTETDLPPEQPAARRTTVLEPAGPGDADRVHPQTSPVPRPRSAEATATRHRPRRQDGGALAGSALSPATWAQALDVLRERTTRR